MIGVVAWVIQGGYGLGMDPRGDQSILIHDRCLLFSGSSIAAIALLYAVTGAIYYLGRGMNRMMGYVHFSVTHAALYVLLWMKDFNPAYEVKGYLECHEFQNYRWWAKPICAMAMVAGGGAAVVCGESFSDVV